MMHTNTITPILNQMQLETDALKLQIPELIRKYDMVSMELESLYNTLDGNNKIYLMSEIGDYMVKNIPYGMFMLFYNPYSIFTIHNKPILAQYFQTELAQVYIDEMSVICIKDAVRNYVSSVNLIIDIEKIQYQEVFNYIEKLELFFKRDFTNIIECIDKTFMVKYGLLIERMIYDRMESLDAPNNYKFKSYVTNCSSLLEDEILSVFNTLRDIYNSGICSLDFTLDHEFRRVLNGLIVYLCADMNLIIFLRNIFIESINYFISSIISEVLSEIYYPEYYDDIIDFHNAYVNVLKGLELLEY